MFKVKNGTLGVQLGVGESAISYAPNGEGGYDLLFYRLKEKTNACEVVPDENLDNHPYFHISLPSKDSLEDLIFLLSRHRDSIEELEELEKPRAKRITFVIDQSAFPFLDLEAFSREYGSIFK